MIAAATVDGRYSPSMRSKHPPLPTAVRPTYRVLRAFGVLLLVAGVVLAVLLAINDRWMLAVWTVGLGITFVVLTWLPPTSRWQLPLTILLGVVVAVSLQSWLVAAGLFVVLAWSAWSRGRVGPLPSDIEPAERGAVMENAEKFVGDFESLGFEQVGAYRATIGRVQITVSVLLSSDSKSYASVTDAVLVVTSLFPDGRRMVTRNSNLSPLPPNVLDSPDRGAAPDELVASHLRALKTLAEHGHSPRQLIAAELTQTAIDGELDAIDWVRDMSRLPRPDYTAPLWKLPDRSDRIAAWQAGGH